ACWLPSCKNRANPLREKTCWPSVLKPRPLSWSAARSPSTRTAPSSAPCKSMKSMAPAARSYVYSPTKTGKRTMSTLVLRHNEGGLACLTLNRPDKLNALTVQMFTELYEHVQDIERDTEHTGVVVLRGAGRCFSAGNDLNDIAAGQPLPMPHFQAKVIERRANLPQPVIAAVHGHCYTGALELALAGDLLVAAESARFADTHAKWALTPLWGMSQRLQRRVGLPKAREM